MGRTTHMEVTQFPVENLITGESEIAESVKCLRLNCSGGPSGMRVEHLHQWLQEATWEESTDAANWEKVAEIEQVECWERSLAKEYAWQTVVIIPKGDDKEFHGIGLVEVLRKAKTRIIIWRLTAVITYHDSLHDFRKGRGMGTAIFEAKMLHQMTSMIEAVLHTMFLDFQKAYNALDQY